MPDIKLVWDNKNDDSVTAWLHANVSLSDMIVNEFHRAKSEAETRGTDLLRTISAIHGVQEVSVTRYKIRIERTKVVGWTAICLKVEAAVKSYCKDINLEPPDQGPVVQA